MLLGALEPTLYAENWEQHGTATPEECSDAFSEAWRETLKGGRCMPVGAVTPYAGISVPVGYLLCDGADYSPDDYPALFAAIGYVYGTAPGGNFRVPNTTGRFVVSEGQSPGGSDVYAAGNTGGEEKHALTTTEMPSHRHSMVRYYEPVLMGEVPSVYSFNVRSGPTGVSEQTYTAGGDAAHENRPPFIALKHIIRAV